MLKKLLILLPVFCLLALNLTQTARAQTTEPPVVHAVMFWMSGCKHCQQTISMTLPPIREKYGAQFELQLIQIYSLEDIDALYDLGASYGIEKHMVGVPFLVIGDQPLVGYDQVRLELETLIETHLATGGVALPDRPELQPLLAAAPDSDSPTPGALREEPVPAPMDFQPAPTGMRDNGFILAIIVLAGMLMALLYAAARLLLVMFTNVHLRPVPAWMTAWAIPALSVAGLLVAAYLSYIEVTLAQAFCGPVGDCNAVQSSSYARLFGILPVGVLGGLGYLAILLAWWANRQKWGIISSYAPLALFGMAFFGTLFSAYLTYLEPFVIKAVCIWCITSAILITLIMLASLQPALQALTTQTEDTDEEQTLLVS